MKNFVSLCVLVAVVGVAKGLPGKYGLYYPKRSMMFGSYYSNPMEGFEYVPQGQMTAMVSGDTVATNSFSGQHWRAPPQVGAVPNFSTEEISENHPPSEPITEKQQQNFSENEADAEFDFEADNKSQEADPASSGEAASPTTEVPVVITSTKAPKVVPSKKISPKRKAKKPVKQEEEKTFDEDEDEEDMKPVWPFGGSNSRRASGFPGYNTFFPIFIGGGGSSRSRTRASGSLEDQEPMMPSGSATAIANSFSTGKGGVATSHATSFGDPMAAAFFRNSGYFGDYDGVVRRNKKPSSENRD